MLQAVFWLIVAVFVSYIPAYGDDGTVSSENLIRRFDEAAEKAKANADKAAQSPIEQRPIDSKTSQPVKRNADALIDDLIQQVDSLQSKVIVNQKVSIATQKPKSAKLVGSRTTYAFKEGNVYEIHSGVDRVTDIELQPGEILAGTPVSGDTVRWKIAVLKSTRNGKEIAHIIIKPLDPEIESNIVIISNKRTYHLRVVAGDWYMPSVSWNYPDEDEPMTQEQSTNAISEEISVRPEQLEFGYDIVGGDFPWTPLRVFDDGAKTYLQMPTSARNHESPALFVIEDSDVVLVNYRVKGSYYIIDRLIEHAQLRIGTARIVDIWTKGTKPSFLARLF